MDCHRNSTAENSVCPKLCNVAHAIMPPISCNGNTSTERLQLFKHLTLVFLPVKIYQWEKLGLKENQHTKQQDQLHLRVN